MHIIQRATSFRILLGRNCSIILEVTLVARPYVYFWVHAHAATFKYFDHRETRIYEKKQYTRIVIRVSDKFQRPSHPLTTKIVSLPVVLLWCKRRADLAYECCCGG